MDIQHEIDKENLIEVIRNAPDQLTAGLELSEGIKIGKRFSSIVLSGMGGSALVGELLQTYLQISDIRHRTSVKVFINRSYNLPSESYEPNCLNIISSYSGNTEETLSSFGEALKNNLPCLGIASGGKVMEICKEKSIPFIQMPIPSPDFQPRLATGYSFAALLNFMANNEMIELDTSLFQKTAEKIKSDLKTLENLGQEIAKKTCGKTPVIYAPIKFRSLAMVWKIMFNENSKTPAFWNYFPELSHNEMIGFTKPQADFHFVILRDNGDSQNLKRLNITVDLFKEHGIESVVIDMPEGEPIYRIFATLQIGSFASYHLALLYGIDPTPVEMVEKLKKLLIK